jgi:hypothetical protein
MDELMQAFFRRLPFSFAGDETLAGRNISRIRVS